MQQLRRFATGAAMSGALAFFAAMTPAEAADPVGEFKAGTIWNGSARYSSKDNSFLRCGMSAKFPEGLELFFALDPKGVLGLDIYGPDDMDAPPPGGKVPVTLSIDGRAFRPLAMDVDDYALEMEELWLFTDLTPAGDYLPALKKGKTITVSLQGQTVEKPPQPKTWTYTAALTSAAEAFQALEACVAKHAGTTGPSAAPKTGSAPSAKTPDGGATSGPTKGSTGVTKKAASYGAIAVGEDGDDLITGISSKLPSLEEAMNAAVEICQRGGGFCQVRATMDLATPCGAVAGGDDSGGGPVYAWGTGLTKAEAELAAMQACSADAIGCRVSLSKCVNP